MSRGCGERVKGGVYATLDLSLFGTPWSTFLVDPPEPQDLDALGVTSVGQHLIPRGDGGYHIFDIVGEQFYPNVADFVMEAYHKGISRRMKKNFDWSKVDTNTRLVLMHRRAWQVNFEMVYQALPNAVSVKCPKHLEQHTWVDQGEGWDIPEQQCLGLAWHDLEGGEPVDPTEWLSDSDLTVRRSFPPDHQEFQFLGYRRPSTVAPLYQPAIFMSVPFRIVVIRDPDSENGSIEKLAQNIASKVPLPVALEDA